MSNRQAGNESGFTLLELMITLSLLVFLGLVAAWVFDTQGWLAHYRLKGAARDLAFNMQKARMSAVKENRDWAIVFDTASNTYFFQYYDNGLPVLSPESAVDLTNNYKSGIAFGHGRATVPIGASFGSNNDNVTFADNEVVFNPKGLANLSGYCYLANGRGDTISVGALSSGVIKIREWKTSSWK